MQLSASRKGILDEPNSFDIARSPSAPFPATSEEKNLQSYQADEVSALRQGYGSTETIRVQCADFENAVLPRTVVSRPPSG